MKLIVLCVTAIALLACVGEVKAQVGIAVPLPSGTETREHRVSVGHAELITLSESPDGPTWARYRNGDLAVPKGLCRASNLRFVLPLTEVTPDQVTGFFVSVDDDPEMSLGFTARGRNSGSKSDLIIGNRSYRNERKGSFLNCGKNGSRIESPEMTLGFDGRVTICTSALSVDAHYLRVMVYHKANSNSTSLGLPLIPLKLFTLVSHRKGFVEFLIKFAVDDPASFASEDERYPIPLAVRQSAAYGEWAWTKYCTSNPYGFKLVHDPDIARLWQGVAELIRQYPQRASGSATTQMASSYIIRVRFPDGRPAKAHLEQIVPEGQRYDLGEVCPQGNIFKFTAPGWRKFRAMCDGFDSGWVSANVSTGVEIVIPLRGGGSR